MPDNQKPPPPPNTDGLYIELGIGDINEGQLIERINRAINRGLRETLDWENQMFRKDGAFDVNVKIAFKRMDGADDFFVIEDEVRLKTPNPTAVSNARLAGNRLLCQPGGSNDGDPDQLLMFDRTGKAAALVDRSTGEVKDPAADGDGCSGVAGSISGSA